MTNKDKKANEIADEIRNSLRGREFSDSTELLREDRRRDEKKLTDFMLNSPLKNSGIELTRSKAIDSRKIIDFENLLSEGLESGEATPLTKADFEAIKQRGLRKLSNRDRDIFLKMLEDDSEPNEALKNAAKIHNELIADE